MLKYVQMVMGGLIVLPIALAVGFGIGVRFEKNKLAALTANNRVTVLVDGKAIDDKVLSADDEGLCQLLNGC